jgi:hypothetical protein
MISMQPPSICLSAFLGLRKKKMIVEAWRRPILIIDGPSIYLSFPLSLNYKNQMGHFSGFKGLPEMANTNY